MKQTMALSLLLLLFACAPKVTPIKGKYLNGPFTVTSEKSIDVVWDRLIDLFAQKGLSIKLIDRSSGLIVSEKSKLSWSRESKTTGELINKEAYVVVERMWDYNSRKNIDPNVITGEWNVRIKKSEDGKTIINVNLFNISATKKTEGSRYNNYSTYVLEIEAKSTGQFEAIIASYIK